MSLLAPPVAFLAYVVLAGLLMALGKMLAGSGRPTRNASALYASGEAAPSRPRSAPGYSGFFGVALFFAVLHVGVLIASTGAVFPIGVVYVLGLLTVLIVAGLD